MHRLCTLKFVAALPFILCSMNCGDAQSGLGRSGAPLPAANIDTGIAGDFSSYQPAKPPTGAGSRGGSGARDSGGGSADVNALLEKLIKNVNEGGIAAALETFNKEHVAALGDNQQSVMILTYDPIETLRKELDRKYDPAKRQSIMNALAGFPDGPPTIDQLDAGSASVKPNHAVLLFGPKIAKGDAMRAQTKDGALAFQLEKPLTEADAAAVVEYHQKLKENLDRLVTAIESGVELDEAQLKELLAKARNGETLDLPTAEPKTPPDAAPKPDDGEKPKDDGEKPEDKPEEKPEEKPDDNP